jgi:hypothetical protein
VVEVPDTATPFRYRFIGTEPGILSAVPSQEGTPEESTPSFGLATIRPTPLVLRTSTPTNAFVVTSQGGVPAATNTPTSGSAPTLNPGTYDDIDSHFVYVGVWSSEGNVGGAYQNTLHVSTAINDTCTFRFLGNQLRIFYQSGTGLGMMRAEIDGVTYDLNQSSTSTNSSEWLIEASSIGTHTITLSHLSGGSINIDQVIVPDVLGTTTPTATSTATPTSTSTP